MQLQRRYNRADFVRLILTRFTSFLTGVLSCMVGALPAGIVAAPTSIWRPNVAPYVFIAVWACWIWFYWKIITLKSDLAADGPKRPPKTILRWNAHAHSDEENVRWSWLRAVEWTSWPAFVSQPIMPVFLWLSPTQWGGLVLALVALNFLWQFCISSKRVSVTLASLGCLFVRLKWIACPVAAYFLWHSDFPYQALAALLWPVAVYVIAPIRIVRIDIGSLQERFMTACRP